MLNRCFFAALCCVFTACSSAPRNYPTLLSEDPFLWLEEIHGPQALNWVTQRNRDSLKEIKSLPRYKTLEAEARKILLAKDRLPPVAQHGRFLYNFWQDDEHVRGVWRRTTVREYKKKKPKWEVILDVDKLASEEKENWVYKGVSCVEPEYQHCLVLLSRGGKDSSVTREFDVEKRAFVAQGFDLPEAKTRVAWTDKDHLLVATDFGPDSLTSSGYPRIVKSWTRGKPLEEAVPVMTAQKEDVGVEPLTMFTAQGNKTFIQRGITFFESEIFQFEPDGKLVQVNKPRDAELLNWFAGHVILSLKSDWAVGASAFKSGDLVALATDSKSEPRLIFSPSEKQTVVDVERTRDALLINYLNNIQGKLAVARMKGGRWQVEDLPFPGGGKLSPLSVDAFGGEVLVSFEGFLTPPSILRAEVDLRKAAGALRTETLKSLPARFNAGDFSVQQLWATSKDGTQVPYFVVGKKNLKADGANPVLLYGYGGFEVSQQPGYLALQGKLWLEKGGTYVLANIRGGSEFGPKWHKAAIKENRQKAYDDFIAVAEDLSRRNITSPQHLASMGASNGGLLVSATFVERPDLFAAVVCRVPLTDMLRFNKLLAGASWMGEYGNPDIPAERAYIAKYSPYQNVSAGAKYPEVFFLTSTMDDRVHPGHARKMAAKMKEQGHALLYFENTEGGHGAAANLEQRVHFLSLEYAFLNDRLLK